MNVSRKIIFNIAELFLGLAMLFSFIPQVLAGNGTPCCTNAECGGGGWKCIGASSQCSSIGKDGECQSQTCFGGIQCVPPDTCTGDICMPAGGGGTSCFPAGTPITLQNKSTKNIEDIKAGDRVLSQDENGRQSISTVQNLLSPVSNNMCQIKFTNGDSLDVTKGHPLFTQNGWKAIDTNVAGVEDPGVPVSTLTTGDFMEKDTGSWSQVSNISCWNTSIQTYNLTVDNSHDYFAGGFLAHNKGCVCGSTKRTTCSKSCPSVFKGDFCGYTKTQPIVAKYTCNTTFCNACPTCTATAPTNIVVTSTSFTSANVTWTRGTGGTSQRIYIGTDQGIVDGGCQGGIGPGTGCVTANTTLTSAQTSYATGNVLTPGNVYYYSVVNYTSASCSKPSIDKIVISSCSLVPSTLTITNGDSHILSSSVATGDGVTQVTFSSGTPGSVSVNPATDVTFPYSTTLTGLASTTPASVTITSKVYLTGSVNPDCTATAAITVVPPGPWWQVGDSDVWSNGDLVSKPPGGSFFGLIGPGGYAGISVYSGLTTLTNATASTQGWLASSASTATKVYDSVFFRNQTPQDTNFTVLPSTALDQAVIDSNTDPSYGYYWYNYPGNGGLPLNLDTPIDIGDKKVILFVSNFANFNINSTINLNDGSGFFLVIATGDINVSPTVGGGGVPNLEGLYFTDGTFSSGLGSTELWVRGSVAANSRLNLQRDLGDPANGTTPAEFFEYAPDQILLFPSKLSARKINWKEVAP